MTGESFCPPGLNLQVSQVKSPELKVQLKKTKLCVFHMQNACREGAGCRFAHGTEELQSTPDLNKTSMCPDMVAGKCTNPDCKFAHSPDEIRTTTFCYKTTQCMWHAMGKCRNGSQCRFAHGEADRNPSAVADKSRGNKSEEKSATKKEKVPLQRRAKENKEMPEPCFIHTDKIKYMVEQDQASQPYLNLFGTQPMMGYPYPGAWMMPSTMPGYDMNVPIYNPAAIPAHAIQTGTESESAVPDSVKVLSEHIMSLTKQVKILQDKVSSSNVNSEPGRSIYSGATSAVSGSTSNDETESSETSCHDLDGWANVAVVDNRLA